MPVNIVEGYGRQRGKERLHFLQIALASLDEAGYCLHAARRLGYLDAATYEQVEVEIKKVAAPLRGLMRWHGREHP